MIKLAWGLWPVLIAYLLELRICLATTPNSRKIGPPVLVQLLGPSFTKNRADDAQRTDKPAQGSIWKLVCRTADKGKSLPTLERGSFSPHPPCINVLRVAEEDRQRRGGGELAEECRDCLLPRALWGSQSHEHAPRLESNKRK